MQAGPPGQLQLFPCSGRGLLFTGRFWSWVLLAVVLLTMGFIRVRLLDFPLERDEGEYAYAGQLILQGVPPYQECYNMKWPGTYVAYAAIMAVFGETTAGIHLGVLCVSLVSALLMFLIGRRIGGDGMGAVAASTQALLAVNPSTFGLAGHATHFVVLLALVGIWVLMVPFEKITLWRCLVAGIFFGLACIMKQQGAVVGIFATLWLAWRGLVQDELSSSEGGKITRDLRGLALRLGSLVAGGVLTLLVMAGVLAAAGVWEKFWYWTVDYGRAYIGIITLPQGLENLENETTKLWDVAPGLWSLAILGLALLCFEPTLRKWRFFLAVFPVFSFLGVCPGLYFREHYFLLLLPAMALLCGAAWCAISRSAGRIFYNVARASGAGDAPALEWIKKPGFAKAAMGIAGGLFVLAALQSLAISSDVFFQLTPDEDCHLIYGMNAFTESMEVARHIQDNSPPNSRIAVLGSEPQIYFYSHRHAAAGYIYTYPLMEPQPFASEMQLGMIRELESAAPEFLVLVWVPNSWGMYPNSDPTIFKWFGRYTREQMQLDGLVEIFPDLHSESHWDMAGQKIRPRTDCWLAIFKRKPAVAQ